MVVVRLVPAATSYSLWSVGLTQECKQGSRKRWAREENKKISRIVLCWKSYPSGPGSVTNPLSLALSSLAVSRSRSYFVYIIWYCVRSFLVIFFKSRNASGSWLVIAGLEVRSSGVESFSGCVAMQSSTWKRNMFISARSRFELLSHQRDN